MGTWTTSMGGGVRTLTGAATRTVLVASLLFSGTASVRLQCRQPADNVKALLLSSRDGRWCWEVGIEGANAVIQWRAAGGAATVEATAPHGLAAGAPFTLEARVVEGVISLYLNGSSSAVVTHDNSVTQRYRTYRHWGIVSAVTGAVVHSMELCGLVAVTSAADEFVVAVCDGDAWAGYSTRDAATGATVYGLRLIKAGAFNASGPVSLTAFKQKVLGLDGTHAVKIDLATFTASDWGGTTLQTALPGARETTPGSGVYVAGTTRMTGVTTFLSRVVVYGDPLDPQNLWMSAVNDEDDYNTASFRQGRAFGTSVNLPGRIGEPIVACEQISKGVLLVACANSLWRFTGDPAITLPDISPVQLGTGISARGAVCTIADGRALVHTPEGLYLVPAFGDPVPLSNLVLTEGVNIPRAQAGDYTVQVRRDPDQMRVFVFRTLTASGASDHVVYEERRGGYSPALGVWFPIDFPDRLGPTASCLWKGRLVMGTRDGYIVAFEDARYNDDGEVIIASMATRLLDEGDERHETCLDALAFVMGGTSGPATYRVYGGRTAEEAFVGADRRLLLSGTVPAHAQPVKRKVRAPALVVELSDSTLDRGFRVSNIEGEWWLGAVTAHRSAFAAPAFSTPCRSPSGDLGAATPTTPTAPTTGPGETIAPSLLLMLGQDVIVSMPGPPWPFGVANDGGLTVAGGGSTQAPGGGLGPIDMPDVGGGIPEMKGDNGGVVKMH